MTPYFGVRQIRKLNYEEMEKIFREGQRLLKGPTLEEIKEAVKRDKHLSPKTTTEDIARVRLLRVEASNRESKKKKPEYQTAPNRESKNIQIR